MPALRRLSRSSFSPQRSSFSVGHAAFDADREPVGSSAAQFFRLVGELEALQARLAGMEGKLRVLERELALMGVELFYSAAAAERAAESLAPVAVEPQRVRMRAKRVSGGAKVVPVWE